MISKLRQLELLPGFDERTCFLVPILSICDNSYHYNYIYFYCSVPIKSHETLGVINSINPTAIFYMIVCPLLHFNQMYRLSCRFSFVISNVTEFYFQELHQQKQEMYFKIPGYAKSIDSGQ